MRRGILKKISSSILIVLLVLFQLSGVSFTSIKTISVQAAGIGTGKKVLFDNAHGQTAGAADWRITTEFKAFGDDLIKLGYEISENNTKFSESVLSGVDVLVIPESNNPFTAEEKQALIKFVESGKGIYFISDHTGADRDNDGWDSTEVFNGYLDGQSGTSENELLNKFGFECLKNTVWQSPIKDIRQSWISNTGEFTKGIGAWAGCTFKINDPTKAQAVAILTPNGPVDSAPTFEKWITSQKGGEGEGAYVVVAKPNKGKVAAIGDSSPVEENSKYHGWTDVRYDDAKMSINIVNWLAIQEDTIGIPADRQTPNVGNGAGTGGVVPPSNAAYAWNNIIPEKKPTADKDNGKLVLFDNSHMNTAGQADWVLDGGFSDFANALVNEGYTVREYRGIDKDKDGAIRFFDDRTLKTADEGTSLDKNEAVITYDAIKDADVFITAEQNRPMRISEKAALKTFVDAGKGIYIIGDHYNGDRNCNTWDGNEVANGYNRHDSDIYNMVGTVYGDMRNPKDASKGWLSENFGVRFRFNAGDSITGKQSGATDIRPATEAEGLTNGVGTSILMAAGATLAITDDTKAKGIVYFKDSDNLVSWANAVEGSSKGIYFGGRKEGPYVAISKPSRGRAAFLGDSSPVEDITAKYKNEKTGANKSLHDGWKQAGNAAKLTVNIVNWLSDSSQDYVGFGSKEHPKDTYGNTPTPMAPQELTDPHNGKPWAEPGYDPWNTDSYAVGSYGAPKGTTGGGTTDPVPVGVPKLEISPLFIYGTEPFGVIIGGEAVNPEFGIYFKNGGQQVGQVKIGDTWSAAGAYYKLVGATPIAITAKVSKVPSDNLLSMRARVGSSQTDTKGVTAISNYGYLEGIVEAEAGDIVAANTVEGIIGTAQVANDKKVKIAVKATNGIKLSVYGKDGLKKIDLPEEYAVKAGEITTIIVGTKNIPVTGISLDKIRLELRISEIATLIGTITPANASNKGILWGSSDDNIASVSNGVVTAKALGKAIITATTMDGSKTASCEIDVKPITQKYSVNIERIGSETAFKVGSDARILIKATNNNSIAKKVTLIIGQFDKDNKLLDYTYASKEVEAKDSINLEDSTIVMSNSVVIKCFIFDTIENMEPLSDVILIQVIK